MKEALGGELSSNRKSVSTVSDSFYELFVYENLEHIIHKYRKQ